MFTTADAGIQHSVTNTCVSIQPADKPIEHLINSYKLLFVLLILDKKIDAISAYLKSNNKGDKKKRKCCSHKQSDLADSSGDSSVVRVPDS